MTKKRDDFSAGVKAVLAHRAGFRCSKPSCRALTVGPKSKNEDTWTNVGVASHITAAAPRGPRFDPTLSSEQRGSATNGIWLCAIHAKEIDDDKDKFTSAILQGWKQHAEEDARALLGKPISTQALDIAIEVILHRAPDDSLIVTGSTNMPGGAKILVDLLHPQTREILNHAQVTVNQGAFAASGFTHHGQPHPHGWYTVEVRSYFGVTWNQPDTVTEIVGRDGKFLNGRFAAPIHPELDESGKWLHAEFECIAPPETANANRTPIDLLRALKLAQEAVLTVDGRHSACTVCEVVDQFMSSMGLRPREGWLTETLPNGAIIVSYSFWERETEAVAKWIVILDSGEVRYKNLYAKYMSWLPDD